MSSSSHLLCNLTKNVLVSVKHVLTKMPKNICNIFEFATSHVKGVVDDIITDMDPIESIHYPMIVKHYNPLEIEMNLFQTMPEHLYFLDLEKSLMSIIELIVKQKNKFQKEFWNSIMHLIS